MNITHIRFDDKGAITEIEAVDLNLLDVLYIGDIIRKMAQPLTIDMLNDLGRKLKERYELPAADDVRGDGESEADE